MLVRHCIPVVTLVACSLVVSSLMAADRTTGAPGNANRPAQPDYGDPLAGLSPAQLAAFNDGKLRFEEAATASTGLGPVFNKESCGTCHNAGPTITPAIGGAGSLTVTRFGRLDNKGNFDPMAEYGGSLRQASAIGEQCAEEVPAEAQIVIQRVTTPVFGGGLIEALADATIQSHEDPDDTNGDGISGRAHIVFDPFEQQMRVGRFGWKAQVATLDTFSADASLNEMGITNELFPDENDPNGVFPPVLADCDMVADPEDAPDGEGIASFNRMAAFQRLLAPPPRRPLLSGRGYALFRAIGCAKCHIPVMFTGASDIPQLAHKPAFLFSDLLLHDMGALGDEIVQGDAMGTEMRTPALWGVRVRPKLLHDGRADAEDVNLRLRQAIEGIPAIPPSVPFRPGHAGEAAASRDAWLALPASDQQAVIEFLKSI